MISIYFGFPRSGKTTYFTKLAKDLLKKGKKVYGNVPLKIEGYIYVDTHCFYTYDIVDAECLIDEGTVFFDSRDYNNKEKKEEQKRIINWICLHGHDRVNIHFFTQIWNRLDKTIRDTSERVYWIYKPILLGAWYTRCVPIRYNILFTGSIDDKGKPQPGDIQMGYVKPSLLDRWLSPMIYRPKYYSYFDSWQRYERPALPPFYSAFTTKN